MPGTSGISIWIEMGQLYQQAQRFVQPAPNTIWVEIGSDRWEGSTAFLAQLALENHAVFHSIDLSKDARRRVHHGNIQWHQADGEHWCHTVLPDLATNISLVYLDNFDYIWDINAWDDRIRDQKKDYLERYGIEMTNQNCQIAHLRQLLAMESYLADDAIVICDDTYTINDCWAGKGGGVVLYLLSQGWNTLMAQDFGVILQKCKKS